MAEPWTILAVISPQTPPVGEEADRPQLPPQLSAFGFVFCLRLQLWDDFVR